MGKEIVVDDPDGDCTCAIWITLSFRTRFRFSAVYLHIVLVEV